MQVELACAKCPVRNLTICGAVDTSASEALRSGGRAYRAGRMIYQDGERTADFVTIVEGWASQRVTTRDGRRQILAFLLPGDHIALDLICFDRLNFSVQAITDVVACLCRRDKVASLAACDRHVLERLKERYRFQSLSAQERIVSLGRRSAAERIARLFIEMSLRLRARGHRDEGALPFPIRQLDIADALGLTPIHVSRVLREFRAEGIVDLSRDRLAILDKRTLMEIGGLRDDDLDPGHYGFRR